MPEPLADPWASRAAEYDVVIVGSGYGGAITAARVAAADIQPKPRICILERGMEWIPGNFPDEPLDALPQFVSPFNPLGLYHFVQQKDISIVQGSGLGGTSLVNANVAIIPEESVFDREPWPSGDQNERPAQLLQRAATTLEISQHPRGLNLLKVKALKKRADQVTGAEFEALQLAVEFHPRRNRRQWRRAPSMHRLRRLRDRL
jgi:cholesterol oxidase